MPRRSAVRVMFHSLARSSLRMNARSKASRASLSVRSRWASSAGGSASRGRGGGGGGAPPAGPRRGPVTTRRPPMFRLARPVPAHPLDGLLLESAQHLSLGLEAHVADLVEEEGALIGQLELAAPPRHRAGERAALVPEQLGLDQLLRDRRAVHLDEGPVAPRGERVDGAGHQLLARAVLALDEHAPARGRRDRDLLAQAR